MALVKINAIDANRTMAPIKGATAVAISKMRLVGTTRSDHHQSQNGEKATRGDGCPDRIGPDGDFERYQYPTARCSWRRRCSISPAATTSDR